jgi:2-polyprenyl-3-methyl-5-hydroxy-6-metoxy-1,4-benzoquinol methylase
MSLDVAHAYNYPPPVAAAFDAVAGELDADTRSSASAERIRDIVTRMAIKTFPAGGRVLEVGCRTGFLTVSLALAGFHVTAVDSSERLLSILRETAGSAGLSARVETLRIPDLDPRSLPEEHVDAAVLPHGIVNLVARPGDLAAAVSDRLPPAAPLIADVLNRHHIVELLAYPLTGRVAKGFRKFGGPVPIRATRSADPTVHTQFYSPREIVHAFSPWFESVDILGALIALPPPSMDRVSRRIKPVLRVLGRFDERVRATYPFNGLGHHFLLGLRRRR